MTLAEPSTHLALALLPDGSVQELAEVDFHDIDDIRKREGAVVWLDITNPTMRTWTSWTASSGSTRWPARTSSGVTSGPRSTPTPTRRWS